MSGCAVHPYDPTMSDVGDLLELMQAMPVWDTVQATVVHRIDVSRLPVPGARPGPQPLGRTGPVEPQLVEERWVEACYAMTARARPFRLRMVLQEHTGNDPLGLPPEVVVDDGHTVWEQHAQRVSRSRARVPHSRHVRSAEWMIAARDVALAHRISVDPASKDGRGSWRVSLDPLPLGDLPTSSLTRRAQMRAELDVDAESGIVMTAGWHVSGRLVESSSLLGVVVGGDVPDEVFSYLAPAGVEVGEGVKLEIPTRFKPAFVLGVLAAAAGEQVAKGVARLRGSSRDT